MPLWEAGVQSAIKNSLGSACFSQAYKSFWWIRMWKRFLVHLCLYNCMVSMIMKRSCMPASAHTLAWKCRLRWQLDVHVSTHMHTRIPYPTSQRQKSLPWKSRGALQQDHTRLYTDLVTTRAVKGKRETTVTAPQVLLLPRGNCGPDLAWCQEWPIIAIDSHLAYGCVLYVYIHVVR